MSVDAKLIITLMCRLCKTQLTVTLPWLGRPQGPQCQCNQNTWGNWRRMPGSSQSQWFPETVADPDRDDIEDGYD